MQAAIYERPGPAGAVLQVTDLPVPEPARGEVRVRVRFAAVNPTDWRARMGTPGGSMPFPRQIPGQDGAGWVDAIGEGVSSARMGEAVWIYHAAHRRPSGTAAQYVVVPAEQAVPLPEGVGLDQGAALGIPFITAHRCVFADGPVANHSVLVAGGAGAVGNAANQWAKRGGAQVIATVSSDAKAELARTAGADHVVDYRDPGAAAEIRSAAPAGIDRVVEVALGTNLRLDLQVIAPGGTIVTYAPELTEPTIPVIQLIGASLRLLFVLVYAAPPDALRHAVQDTTDALADGALRPLPSVHFPLSEIVAAHVASEDGAVGKILIDLP